MIKYVSQTIRQASHEATVLLYSPGIEPFLEDLAKSADRSTSRKGGGPLPGCL